MIATNPCASAADFCQNFCEEMNGPYLLSFLLPADRQTTEKCLVLGVGTEMSDPSQKFGVAFSPLPCFCV
jgi:hypothetical protein